MMAHPARHQMHLMEGKRGDPMRSPPLRQKICFAIYAGA
jgi:hypothetical protein